MMPIFSNKNEYCECCKGKCWVEGNQHETQKRSKKKFGIIPNNCVNMSDGPQCPYRHKK